jgi:heme exporter protein D
LCLLHLCMYVYVCAIMVVVVVVAFATIPVEQRKNLMSPITKQENKIENYLIKSIEA